MGRLWNEPWPDGTHAEAQLFILQDSHSSQFAAEKDGLHHACGNTINMRKKQKSKKANTNVFLIPQLGGSVTPGSQATEEHGGGPSPEIESKDALVAQICADVHWMRASWILSEGNFLTS